MSRDAQNVRAMTIVGTVLELIQHRFKFDSTCSTQFKGGGGAKGFNVAVQQKRKLKQNIEDVCLGLNESKLPKINDKSSVSGNQYLVRLPFIL